MAILAQRTSCPTQEDWDELKRVVKYLKGTIDLVLKLGDLKDNNPLVGYADANWAENRTDRSWSCRKQTCVSLSSTEAEFIALSEACREAIWLRKLLEDFEQPLDEPTLINEDNQSCLALITQEGFSNRSKHIDTRHNFIRDNVQKGIITCRYCPTEEMLADICTKALGATKIAHLRKLSGII